MKDVSATFLKNQPHRIDIFENKSDCFKFTSTPLFEKWTKENDSLTFHQRGTKNVFDMIQKRNLEIVRRNKK